MHPIRPAAFLATLLFLAGCETPAGGDDRDARYGLKPSAGGSSRLDSDNVYAGQHSGNVSSRATVGPGVESPVPLKSFRSTQRMAPSSAPRPSPTPKMLPTPRIPPTPKSTPTPKPKATPKPSPIVEETALHEDAPQNETASLPAERPPFASPVPGKKGYVTSPFSPAAGFIDVTGLEPGSEAKDPYTGKVFRVP